MKLSVFISLLFVLPIIGMDNTPEQTTTKFSEECLDKCAPCWAMGGLLGAAIGGLCIGVPVITTLGMGPAVATAFLFCTTLGGSRCL